MNLRRVLLRFSLILGLGLLLPSLSAPALAVEFPPTDGAMRGFVLLKERTPAPQTPFFTAAGSELLLEEFEGKVLIVNFWATWCAPCVHEMPALDRLQAAFADQAFEVIAINQDRGGARVAEPFMRERLGLENLAIYLDPKFKLGRAFKNRGLPATYAIDKQGMLVGGLFGAAEWDSEDAKALVRHLLEE
ncbi:MAG: TlpA disulfide reductase family protein [Alphaproteobacteria bacterium]|nr:TlpA disulfide reductase family protein [Alphaproteobacteria bacterium]